MRRSPHRAEVPHGALATTFRGVDEARLGGPRSPRPPAKTPAAGFRGPQGIASTTQGICTSPVTESRGNKSVVFGAGGAGSLGDGAGAAGAVVGWPAAGVASPLQQLPQVGQTHSTQHLRTGTSLTHGYLHQLPHLVNAAAAAALLAAAVVALAAGALAGAVAAPAALAGAGGTRNALLLAAQAVHVRGDLLRLPVNMADRREAATAVRAAVAVRAAAAAGVATGCAAGIATGRAAARHAAARRAAAGRAAAHRVAAGQRRGLPRQQAAAQKGQSEQAEQISLHCNCLLSKLSRLGHPREKGTVPICRNGPKGALHKWGLSPFSLPVKPFAAG